MDFSALYFILPKQEKIKYSHCSPLLKFIILLSLPAMISYRQFQNSLFEDNNCSSPSLSHFLLCLPCAFPAGMLMSCTGISTYFQSQSVIKVTCEISLSSLGWESGLNAFTLSPATKISAALCGRH